VFHKSAIYAGFIDTSTGRFVKPGNGVPGRETGENDKKISKGGGGGAEGGGGSALDLDPLLIELLRKIPSKEDGWPPGRRARWFRTFAMNVSQIYDKDDEPVELEIEIAKKAE
jgi:hypothetical protein